jgi:hypothetical protein
MEKQALPQVSGRSARQSSYIVLVIGRRANEPKSAMSDARHRSPPAAVVAAVQIMQIMTKDVARRDFWAEFIGVESLWSVLL